MKVNPSESATSGSDRKFRVCQNSRLVNPLLGDNGFMTYETRRGSRLSIGLITLLIWATAVGSVAFWWLRLGDAVAPSPVPMVEPSGGSLSIDARMVARALGASESMVESAIVAPADPDLARRLTLRGVLTYGADGTALIAVDGESARPVRVGAPISGLNGGWILRSVTSHAAVLATNAHELLLEMPPMEERSRESDVVASGARRPPGVVPRRTRTGSGQSVGVAVPSTPKSR